MIRTIAITSLLCIGSACLAANDSQEPAVKYALEINGQSHELVLDKPVKLQGVYNNPKVVLRASAIRQFTYGNIEFQYPASFGWEAEIEDHNTKSWTLSGNDFTIIHFILPDVLSLETYVQTIAKQFGEGDTRISDTERELGGQKYPGKLLFVTVASTTLSIEAYSLPAKTGSSLLVLQDSPSDNRTVSKEGAAALAMLTRSFKLTTISDKLNSGDGK